MTIKIHNDGKGRHQSFEAYITDTIGCNYVQIAGYGASEQDAINDLTLAIKTYVEGVNTLVNDYMDANKVYVDYNGNKI